MSRLERLGAAIEAPLLVTYGVNVRYLTGFDSSNCALLVEPGGGTTLYTDFRYLEAAQAVDGSRSSDAARRRRCTRELSPAGASDSRQRGSYAQWETIGAGGADSCRRAGVVEALRAVKDESGSMRSAGHAPSPTPSMPRSSRSRSWAHRGGRGALDRAHVPRPRNRGAFLRPDRRPRGSTAHNRMRGRAAR